ncbi:MAG: helix-turn-helix domain-containing protein [Bacteroidota bacterium]
MIQPAYPISLPAAVWQSPELSPSAKLLYGEIAYLCENEGYCPLSYSYFAERHYVTRKTIKSWLAQLEAARLVRVRYDPSGQQRLLYLEPPQEEASPNQLPLTFIS